MVTKPKAGDKTPKTIDEVFGVYKTGRVDLSESELWVRFDHEFVRMMNAKNISGEALAKLIGAPWRTLNSEAKRDREPEWMTAYMLSAMKGVGFDVMYVVLNQRQPSPEEMALLDNYRNTSAERKKTLQEVGSAFAESQLDTAADGTYADRSRRGR